MATIIEYWQCDTDIKRSTGSKIKKKMLLSFNILLKNYRKNSIKLQFYKSIKPEFGPETYLEMTQELFKSAKHLIRIRISSQLFHIKTGRYLNLPVHERICRCCTDLENAQLLAVLPIPEVYMEDEEHIIFSCQFFQNIRDQRHPRLKALYATNDSSKLFIDTNVTTCLLNILKEMLRDFHTRQVVNVRQPGPWHNVNGSCSVFDSHSMHAIKLETNIISDQIIVDLYKPS